MPCCVELLFKTVKRAVTVTLSVTLFCGEVERGQERKRTNAAIEAVPLGR